MFLNTNQAKYPKSVEPVKLTVPAQSNQLQSNFEFAEEDLMLQYTNKLNSKRESLNLKASIVNTVLNFDFSLKVLYI